MKVIRKIRAVAKKDPHFSVAVITIIALVLRIMAVVYLDLRTEMVNQNFTLPSASEPYAMAKSLINEGVLSLGPFWSDPSVYVPTANQPPFYPLFLVAILKLVPDERSAFILVQLINVLIGSCLPLLVYKLSSKFFSNTVALISSAITAVSPLLIYSVAEPHSITVGFAVTMWASIVYTNIAQSHAPALRYYAIAGVITGICVLIRSELALLIPIVGLVFASAKKPRSGVGSFAFIGIAALVVSPWIIRNAISIGKPSLSTTMFLNLYRGNHATANGGSYSQDGTISWPKPDWSDPKWDLIRSDKDFELRLEEAYKSLLIQDVSQNPTRVLTILPNKFLYYIVGDLNHPKSKSPIAISLLSFSALFAAAGVVIAIQHKIKLWPILIWPCLYLLVVLLFFALPRYRLNAEPYLHILSSIAIVALYNKVNPHKKLHLLSEPVTTDATSEQAG